MFFQATFVLSKLIQREKVKGKVLLKRINTHVGGGSVFVSTRFHELNENVSGIGITPLVRTQIEDDPPTYFLEYSIFRYLINELDLIEHRMWTMGQGLRAILPIGWGFLKIYFEANYTFLDPLFNIVLLFFT